MNSILYMYNKKIKGDSVHGLTIAKSEYEGTMLSVRVQCTVYTGTCGTQVKVRFATKSQLRK